MKRCILGLITFILMMLLVGCTDEYLTRIGRYQDDNVDVPNVRSAYVGYPFMYNDVMYELLHGEKVIHRDTVPKLQYESHKIYLLDYNQNIIMTIPVETEYSIDQVFEKTDIDGTVYFIYSQWDTMLGNLFVENLKNSHILEIDMENFSIKNQYDFGASIVVITVHDGYVYTMEDGRVYREPLVQSEGKECLADLGFRGAPDYQKMEEVLFHAVEDGFIVETNYRDPDNPSIYKWEVLAEIKFTDQAMEME